jgi:hypothetical protein
MVMKQISKFLIIVMVVALFVAGLPGGVVKASVPPVLDPPASIAFKDGGAESNHYIGDVTIGKATYESNIVSYLLYWANDFSILGNPFDAVFATGLDEFYTYKLARDTLISNGYLAITRLAVVSNNNGNQSTPIFIPLIDDISASITPSPSPTYNSLSVHNFPVDRPGNAYFDVVDQGVTPLTYGQLTAGDNATSVSKPVASVGTIPVSIPGLSANTWYTLYMVTVDNSGNHSSIKTFDFNTFVAPERDDEQNTVSNMTSALEYNFDNNGYILFNNESFSTLDFSGNHTLLVRVAEDSETGTSTGPVTTLTFTTNPSDDFSRISATSNAAGNKIIIHLSTELDASYFMKATNFIVNLNGSPVSVNSALRDTNDPANKTIILTLNGSVLNNAIPVTLSMLSGAFKTNSNVFSPLIGPFQVTTFNQIDLTDDGIIGIDDMVSMINNPNLQVDMNHDGGVFNRDDILLILNLIAPILDNALEPL